MQWRKNLQKGSGTVARRLLGPSTAPPRYRDRSSFGGLTIGNLQFNRLGVVIRGDSQHMHFLTGLRDGSTSRRLVRFGGVRSSSESCGIRFLI